MTQNRKRSRNFEDEVEFMPLSKRINNLHINNMMTDSGRTEWSQERLSESPNGSDLSLECNCNHQYSPDLNESQNPHYFNINKLLYEMYLERMNRGCHQI